MNQKTVVIAAVLAAALLTGIFSITPMAAYAGDGEQIEEKQEEETDEQETTNKVFWYFMTDYSDLKMVHCWEVNNI